MADVLKVREPLDGDTYAHVLQFYAHQMQLLDERQAEEWAEGFTEDGVFAQNVKPEPWAGRATIAAKMREGMNRLAAREPQVQRRHWFGMVDASREDADTIKSRYYAVVYETPVGGKASVYLSCTGEDTLVRRDGSWLIQHRLITHDAT